MLPLCGAMPCPPTLGGLSLHDPPPHHGGGGLTLGGGIKTGGGTIGKILLGHFWYSNFCPPPPPTPSDTALGPRVDKWCTPEMRGISRCFEGEPAWLGTVGSGWSVGCGVDYCCGRFCGASSWDGHEATDTGLAYAPVSQAHGHHHVVLCCALLHSSWDGGGGGAGAVLPMLFGSEVDLQ